MDTVTSVANEDTRQRTASRQQHTAATAGSGDTWQNRALNREEEREQGKNTGRRRGERKRQNWQRLVEESESRVNRKGTPKRELMGRMRPD